MVKIQKTLILSVAFVFLSVVTLSQASAQEDYRKVIKVGSSALWVETIDNKVYVTNPVDGTIVVIDENSDKVIDTIDAGKGVILFEVVKDKNKLYTTFDSQNNVSVFDLTTLSKIKDISLGNSQTNQSNNALLWDNPYGPYLAVQTSGGGLAYDSANEMLYVIHAGVNSLSVIDTKQDKVVNTIPVGITPVLIKIDDATNTGYVTNWESNDVTVIDLNTNNVTGSVKVGSVPDQMAIDPVNKELYVTNHASPNVAVIDLKTNSLLTQIKLSGPTHAIAFNSKNSIMLVTYTPSSPVTVSGFLNRTELVDTKTNTLVGGYNASNPFSISVDSDKQKLYAAIFSNGTVVSVDLSADPQYTETLGKNTNPTIPEFGPIVSLVLVIATISIVAISKSKLKISY